jgi:CheY-like chemotaxis protein
MTAQSSTQLELSDQPSSSAGVDPLAPSIGPALRRNRRFEVALDVSFDNFPSRAVQRTTNISKTGAFVMTDLSPPADIKITLKITLPSGEQLTTTAEVIHIITAEQAAGKAYPAGLGLRFLHSNPEFRRRLSRYITDLQSGYPRVLIVDDDEDFRAALADGLGVLGMTVDFAESGEDALQKLVEHLFQIDLVLLDIRMPGLDGRGFLYRVRQLGGELDLPIVVLSAAPRAELQSLKGPHGANDVLSKNDPLEEIAARVRDVLGR